MIYKCKCKVCGATCWARGWDEPDTNSGGVNDDETFDDGCEHLQAGGDYDIVDSEYDSGDDD